MRKCLLDALFRRVSSVISATTLKENITEFGAQFSVDDFESVGTSAWEGVRNYEARNLMKEMKEGDKVRAISSAMCLTRECANLIQVRTGSVLPLKLQKSR